MKKQLYKICGMLALGSILFAGCANKNAASDAAVKETKQEAEETAQTTAATAPGAAQTGATSSEATAPDKSTPETQAELPDGIYSAEFDTDSSMFHLNEACDGRGTLTVKGGKMTIHVSLVSKNVLNLYPGLAEDAEKEGAELLSPTLDTVTYSDGLTEEVYGFDVPVSGLDQEFDLALIGTKGKWYDHKVSVSNPEPILDKTDKAEIAKTESDGLQTAKAETAKTEASKSQTLDAVPEDGVYTVELDFEGGSGKAEILSPAAVTVSGGIVTARVRWNSPNYDYMTVGGEKHLPVNTEGDSVFEIPVTAFDEPIVVIGDTVAMSKPHEIEYTLTFHSDTMKPAE